MNLTDLLVTPKNSMREVIAFIDRNSKGIALVVDEEQRLVGTVTDGDIRRAILAGLQFETPVRAILENKGKYPGIAPQPLTAAVGTDPASLLQTMKEQGIRHIPLVDSQMHVLELITLEELLPDEALPLQAVIMAGGLGTRLRPLTEDLPKPMLPVGDRPLMERTMMQLEQAGIRRVNVTTYYKPEKIVEHFGDGSRFGVDISYIHEEQPLGTGGALGLMVRPQETLLVINGDVLTGVDFKAMLNFHREQAAELTVAVGRYQVEVPYGVLECEGSKVLALREKPQIGFFVNAGIYLLEPAVYDYIHKGNSFNMTDLIQWLLEAGRKVAGFPIYEYWLDIGQHDDYEKAQRDLRKKTESPGN